MNFNFDVVEKAAFGGGKEMPPKTVRVSNKGLSFSPDLMVRWSGGEKTAHGHLNAKLSFGIDHVNQAIQVSKDKNGFSVSDNGSASTGYLTIPKNMKQRPPVVGDYVEHPEHPNVFVLAR